MSLWRHCNAVYLAYVIYVIRTPQYIWVSRTWESTESEWYNPNKPKHNTNMCFWIYLPLNKLVAISQTMISNGLSCMKSFVFWLTFQLSLFLRVIDNNPALVKIMACRRMGNKMLILSTQQKRETSSNLPSIIHLNVQQSSRGYTPGPNFRWDRF